MTRFESRATLVLATLAIALGLPLLGWWAHRDSSPRCERDGLAVVPQYRVRIVDAAGDVHFFCGIACAERWLDGERPDVREVYVTDETSGDEIDAGHAWFVRSSVLTNAVTRNRIHAFERREDAAQHADAFAGEILQGSLRPLQYPR